MQKAAGIFEHHPRPLALTHKLGDELTHPFIAPMEDGSIVVVPDLGVVHHVLQVANNLSRSQVAAATGDQRLVHMQRDGKGALDAFEVDEGAANHYGATGGLTPDFVARAITLVKKNFTLRGCGIASYDPVCDPKGRFLKAGIHCIREIASEKK